MTDRVLARFELETERLVAKLRQLASADLPAAVAAVENRIQQMKTRLYAEEGGQSENAKDICSANVLDSAWRQTWKKQIVEGKTEGAEPEIKGEGVFTLKKVETRGNIQIAFVEGKANLKINKETPAGVLVADGTVDLKAQIAVPGGYVVELKQNLEIRGNAVAKDPLTDKETKHQTALTRTTEIKLQQ